MAPSSNAARFSSLARKGVEASLRIVGRAPEFAQAEELARRMTGVGLPPVSRSVLIISPRDWAVHVQFEAMIAHALRFHGVAVDVVTCLGGLPICDRVNTYEGPPSPCRTCGSYSRHAWRAHGFPIHDVAAGTEDEPRGLDESSLDELEGLVVDGVPVGAVARRTARWFLCSSALDTDPLAPPTIRALTKVAGRLARSTTTLFDQIRPDAVFMLNGKFLFESIAASIAEQRGIRVISYERGQVHGSLFIADGPNAPDYDVSDLWGDASQRSLDLEQEQRLDAYLDSRRAGTISYVDLWPETNRDVERARPHVVVFTNVTWDTAAHGANSAFESMATWLDAVLRVAASYPAIDFRIRIHPAEIRIERWRTREPAADLIARSTVPRPPNVEVIGPEDPLSSYDLIDNAVAGLVYTSTAGLELALAGVPTVTAGGPHYAGKGFTVDASRAADFAGAVDRALSDPREEVVDVELARRYANLFFFDAPVPSPPVSEPLPGLARLGTTDPEHLKPGAHRGLDRICARILGS